MDIRCSPDSSERRANIAPRCSPGARPHEDELTSFEVGPDRPFFLIAGPCVIESEAWCIDVAGRLKEMTGALGIPFIFKASFDKANRSSRVELSRTRASRRASRRSRGCASRSAFRC